MSATTPDSVDVPGSAHPEGAGAVVVVVDGTVVVVVVSIGSEEVHAASNSIKPTSALLCIRVRVCPKSRALGLVATRHR